MKESKESRVNRLKTARQNLYEQVNKLKATADARNKEFKISRLRDQADTITRRINRLGGV